MAQIGRFVIHHILTIRWQGNGGFLDSMMTLIESQNAIEMFRSGRVQRSRVLKSAFEYAQHLKGTEQCSDFITYHDLIFSAETLR